MKNIVETIQNYLGMVTSSEQAFCKMQSESVEFLLDRGLLTHMERPESLSGAKAGDVSVCPFTGSRYYIEVAYPVHDYTQILVVRRNHEWYVLSWDTGFDRNNDEVDHNEIEWNYTTAARRAWHLYVGTGVDRDEKTMCQLRLDMGFADIQREVSHSWHQRCVEKDQHIQDRFEAEQFGLPF